MNNIQTYPFYTAITHLNDIHGIDMNPDDFESIGFHAWNHIGNKNVKFYRFTDRIQNNKLDLPCNVEIIESVTIANEDFYMPENQYRENYSALTIETYIEGRKQNKPMTYQSGKLINYELVDNTLYFRDFNNIDITVLYKGVVVDEENGLPTLNFKEVEAIANYCAFIQLRKRGMMLKDPSLIQMSQMIQNDWKRSCDDARSPIYMSENDMNQILDVRSSWDRKRFGKSFKPIK